jgi:two-component system nitrate/nitrite response regulator NarL
MSSTAVADHGVAPRAGGLRRLFVAWQDPETRSITPVGCLTRRQRNNGESYEFHYLPRARQLRHFRPFVGFPSIDESYESANLFPFFENRIMPRTRDDYSKYMGSLGLSLDADPFEVLARSEGRRATDTIEVFPEPSLEDGSAICRFLVHGIRHIPGAQRAIDDLNAGDTTYVLPDPQNKVDKLAVLLRTGDYHLLGYIPSYLTSLIHRPLAAYGADAVQVSVEHIGDRHGPSHLRLLCMLTARWPDDSPPLSGEEFVPLGIAKWGTLSATATESSSLGSAEIRAIPIAVVDDEPVLLRGLEDWLTQTGRGLEIVATAQSVDQLLSGPGRSASVVLLDLRLRDGRVIADNVRDIMGAGAVVVAFSTLDDPSLIREAIRAGAHSYVSASVDASEVRRAIEAAAAGERYTSSAQAAAMETAHESEAPDLSDREREVLRLYASGLTIESIARRLGVKPGTAKSYLHRVRHKYEEAGRSAETEFELRNRALDDG